MAAAITVETGEGLEAANSYISLADANTFFDTHPQASGWQAQTDDAKTRLLITATRVIDASFNFIGFKTNALQALQWPRILAKDRNQYAGPFRRTAATLNSEGYFADDVIPEQLKAAQCELARFLLVDATRLDDAPGTGIREFELTGTLKVAFAAGDLRKIIPEIVSNLLKDLGEVIGGSSAVKKLTRA